MTAMKKFMFDLDFDAEPADNAAEPAPEPEPDSGAPEQPAEPPAVYTEADLESAKDEAYQRGYEAGREAGHAEGREAAETEADAAARQALTQVAQGIDRLAADLDSSEARRDREALELAVAMVRRLFPEVQRRYGLTEVENLIQHTLQRLRETPHVVVRAHPDTLAHLENRADALAAEAGFDGKLRFLAQAEMDPSDVSVTWSDGSAHRDTAGVWAEIDAAVRNALGDQAALDGENDDSAAAAASGGAATSGRDARGGATTTSDTATASNGAAAAGDAGDPDPAAGDGPDPAAAGRAEQPAGDDGDGAGEPAATDDGTAEPAEPAGSSA